MSVLCLFGFTFLSTGANAQNISLDVRNQRYTGDTLFFDVYLKKNRGCQSVSW